MRCPSHITRSLYICIAIVFKVLVIKMDTNEHINSSGPLDYDAKPWKKLLLRGWFGITFLAILIAFILGLVKAKDDAVMYLLVVNLLVSGIIGATIAWWFHKGHIKSQSLVFILFVGICIVFQAIVSDIYLYHNPKSSDSSSAKDIVNGTVNPTSTYKMMTGITQSITGR